MNILGIHLSGDVLWLGGAAVVAVIGINMMNSNGGMTQTAFARRRSYEDVAAGTTPPVNDPRPITDRVAAIIERISAFQSNSLEARQRHSDAIRAIVQKYRTQIVAVVMAFKVKIQQLVASNAPRNEIEKAKADVKMQIIDLIHKMMDEIHDVPRPAANLDVIKKRIQDTRNAQGLTPLPGQGNPWWTT